MDGVQDRKGSVISVDFGRDRTTSAPTKTDDTADLVPNAEQLERDVLEVQDAVALILTGEPNASNGLQQGPVNLAEAKRKMALERLARMEKLGIKKRELKKARGRVSVPKLRLAGDAVDDFSPNTDPAVIGPKFRKKLLLVADNGVSVNRTKKRGVPNKGGVHTNATMGEAFLNLHKAEVYKVKILWEEILDIARKRKKCEKMLEAHDIFKILIGSPHVARVIRQMCLVSDEDRRIDGRKRIFELADEVAKLMRAGKTKMAYNVVAFIVLKKF